MAQFGCTLQGIYNQWMEITGTQGAIKIHWPFRHPRFMIQKDGKEEFEPFAIQADAYTKQVEHFGDCILTGQSLRYGPEESLANTRVIDAIFQSAKQKQVG